MNLSFGINIAYIVSAALFVVGLKMLSSLKTARQGNFISALGMFLAIIATLLTQGLRFEWIILGIALGTIVGILSAKRIEMTAMPQMVALFNGLGGLASFLVGWAVYHSLQEIHGLIMSTIFLSILIGGVTFTGSIIAWGKLNSILPSRPILFKGQKILNVFLFTSLIISGLLFSFHPSLSTYSLFLTIGALALVLGVSSVVPIGGADMPVVISLLNSYSGLAACAAGFVIQNNILIVAGALVGASGIILTRIMCKAMNRSLTNVLFSGFGSVTLKSISQGDAKAIKPINIEDAYLILEAANSVVLVPGYGLAVAQAQHALRELGQALEANGAEIRYAIHPVAGRMPGHMNVLLAEANVSYDQLVEMDSVNPMMESVDVCVVIGANDVVNPSALKDPQSPIFGMPIIEAHRAKIVFVLKRSMASGFAGIDNPLFEQHNTRMLFGDAKASLSGLVSFFNPDFALAKSARRAD